MSSLSYDVVSYKNSLLDSVNNSPMMLNTLSDLQGSIKNGLDKVSHDLTNVSLEVYGLSTMLRHHFAQQFIQNEKRNELLDSIDHSLKNPNKTAALEQYEMGVQLVKRGKFNQSLPFFMKSTELNPLHYRTYVQLTIVHLFLGEFKEALAYSKECIDFTPDGEDEILAYSYSLSSKCYYCLGDYENSEKMISKSTSLCDETQYIYEKARCLAKMNATEESFKNLSEAIFIDEHYFEQALIDDAFDDIRDVLLPFLEKIKETAIQHALSILKAIKDTKVPLDLFEINSSNVDYNKKNQLEDYVKKHCLYTVTNKDGKLRYVKTTYNNFLETINEITEEMKICIKQADDLFMEDKMNIYISIKKLIGELNMIHKSIKGKENFINRVWDSVIRKTSLYYELLYSGISHSQDRIKWYKQEIKKLKKKKGGLFSLVDYDTKFDAQYDIDSHLRSIERLEKNIVLSKEEMPLIKQDLDKIKVFVERHPVHLFLVKEIPSYQIV